MAMTEQQKKLADAENKLRDLMAENLEMKQKNERLLRNVESNLCHTVQGTINDFQNLDL